jgi:hypothetical protein
MEVILATATVAVVAFVLLQLKELYDAGRLDTRGVTVDALLVAGGMFVVNVAQQLLKRRR